MNLTQGQPWAFSVYLPTLTIIRAIMLQFVDRVSVLIYCWQGEALSLWLISKPAVGSDTLHAFCPEKVRATPDKGMRVFNLSDSEHVKIQQLSVALTQLCKVNEQDGLYSQTILHFSNFHIFVRKLHFLSKPSHISGKMMVTNLIFCVSKKLKVHSLY